MFKTKNLVHNIKDVPIPWMFEHFCKLKEKLTGQDVKIKSIFNSKERTPSMCIYVSKTGVYKFKDFSTGKSGSAIDLVKDMHQLKFHQAAELIIEIYNDFILHNNGGYDVGIFKKQSKYKVSQYVLRGWTNQDAYYWTQFNIGSKMLDEYNVRPLSSYYLHKEESDSDDKTLVISSNYLYGYFKKDGSLYKIYQPKTLDKKFIKVRDYIQGMEQLSKQDYLVITSSLKDIMSIKSLKLSSIDVVAPDSENTMIKAEQMQEFQESYKKIIIIFDNDEAGIKSMQKYKENYPFVEVAVLPLSKDPSDSIKDHGAKKTREVLITLINKKIS